MFKLFQTMFLEKVQFTLLNLLPTLPLTVLLMIFQAMEIPFQTVDPLHLVPIKLNLLELKSLKFTVQPELEVHKLLSIKETENHLV